MARSHSDVSVVALLLGLCSTAAFALNPTTVRSAAHAPPVAAHAQPSRPSVRATSPPPRLQMRPSGARSPLLTHAAVRWPLRMCAAADGRSPLQRLAVAEFQGSKDRVASEGKPKYDAAIHAQLAASRRRSYQQDRKGCCSKAASYLDSTMARCDEATRDQADDA